MIPILATTRRACSFPCCHSFELHDDRASDVLPVKSLPNEFWRGRFGVEVGWQVRLPTARRPTLRVAFGTEHESDHKSYDYEYYERNLNDLFLSADSHWPFGRGFVSGALVGGFHSNTHTRVCVGDRESFEQALEVTGGFHPWTSDRFGLSRMRPPPLGVAGFRLIFCVTPAVP
jgi:hypothetical protein